MSLMNIIDEINKKDDGVFEPFLLSVCMSANTPEKQERAPFGWDTVYVVDSEESFISYITSRPYSNTIFRKYNDIPSDVIQADGSTKKSTQRSTRNAIGLTDAIIFDIDDGMKIEDAKKRMDQYGKRYAIVSTKSHLIKPNDRFRIFLFLDFKKVPDFHSKGLFFKTEDDVKSDKKGRLIRPDKQKQLREIECLKITIARELGFKLKMSKDEKEDIDTGAMRDIARKYMPSPAKNKENFVFHADWSLPRFDIEPHLPAVRALVAEMEAAEKEKAARISAKFSGSKDIQTQAIENPTWKIIRDMGAVSRINPFPIIYHYESMFDPSTKILNGYTDKPRTKRSGHEYAIYFKSENSEYVIRDFVEGQTSNLIGYMKSAFPGLSTFDVLLKIQTEFKDELEGGKLLHTNPYYYLSKIIEALGDNAIGSDLDLDEALSDKKICKNVSIGNDSISITEMSGYLKKFKISDDEKEIETIHANSPLFIVFKKIWSEFVKKKAEIEENGRRKINP